MLLPSIRPEFRRELNVPVEAVTAAVSRALLNAPERVVGSVAGTVVELHMRREERHIFSPWLSVVVHRRARTVVVGSYGPSPDVWTFFVALFALCFFTATAGLVGGLAQQTLGTTPWGWIGVFVGLCGGMAVYSAALLGRSIARTQVMVLADFIDRCIDDAERESQPDPADGER